MRHLDNDSVNTCARKLQPSQTCVKTSCGKKIALNKGLKETESDKRNTVLKSCTSLRSAFLFHSTIFFFVVVVVTEWIGVFQRLSTNVKPQLANALHLKCHWQQPESR